jgi:hypothetical protein
MFFYKGDYAEAELLYKADMSTANQVDYGSLPKPMN